MNYLPLLAAAALAAPSFAQQYDDNGDIIGAVGGPAAPGSVLQSISGPSSRYNDLAHDGQYLMVLDGSVAAVQLLHDVTGALMGSIPVANASDFGLAWDDERELVVTTNASTDVVYVYTRTGALVTSWPFPSTGFVGAAWDCRRDVYWVLDWSANTVTALDPMTGAPGVVYGTAAIGCTRGAGLCYDANTDTLYMGGRDQRTVFGMNAATGGLVCSFLGDQGSSSNPHGIAISPRGGVWEGTYQGTFTLHEYESCTPTHPELRFGPNFPIAGNAVTLTMSRLMPNERGIFVYSRAGCGPTASPIGDLLVSNPRFVLAIVPSSGAGVATISGTLPGGLGGSTLFFHGGGLGGSGRCNNVVINP